MIDANFPLVRRRTKVAVLLKGKAQLTDSALWQDVATGQERHGRVSDAATAGLRRPGDVYLDRRQWRTLAL